MSAPVISASPEIYPPLENTGASSTYESPPVPPQVIAVVNTWQAESGTPTEKLEELEAGEKPPVEQVLQISQSEEQQQAPQTASPDGNTVPLDIIATAQTQLLDQQQTVLLTPETQQTPTYGELMKKAQEKIPNLPETAKPEDTIIKKKLKESNERQGRFKNILAKKLHEAQQRAQSEGQNFVLTEEVLQQAVDAAYEDYKQIAILEHQQNDAEAQELAEDITQRLEDMQDEIPDELRRIADTIAPRLSEYLDENDPKKKKNLLLEILKILGITLIVGTVGVGQDVLK